MKTIEINKPENLGAISSSASIKWGNFTTTKLSCSLLCPAIDSPSPYTYLEEVTLTLNGEVILIGHVTEIRQTLQGESYSWQLTISDGWYALEQSKFIGSGTGDDDKLPCLIACIRPPEGQPQMKVTKAIEVVLKNAKSAGLLGNYLIDIAEDDVLLPFTISGSHASILKSIKTQRPNLITYFRYDDLGAATLVVCDQERAGKLVLDRLMHSLKSIELTARHDLVPSCVAVIAVTPSTSRVMTIYPPDADVRKPGAIVTSVNYPGDAGVDDTKPEEEDKGIGDRKWNFTRQSMTVKGRKMPTSQEEATKWWQDKQPLLKQVSNVQYGEIKREFPDVEDKGKAYSQAAVAYELVSGSISEKCVGIKWCEVIFSQFIEVRGGDPPPSFRSIFNIYMGHKHWGGWLVWRGKTINVSRKTYTIAPDGAGPGESDEPPEDVEQPGSPEQPNLDYKEFCKSYYESTRIVPYTGSLSSAQPPKFVDMIGRTLNITGGRAEWLTMQAIVQTVSYDLFSRHIDLTTGAAEHLSLDDMIERSRKILQLQDSTNANDHNDLDDRADTGSSSNFDFDPRAKQIPTAPTISPGGSLTTGESEENPGFAFEVIAVRDKDRKLTGVNIRNGNFYLVGQSHPVFEEPIIASGISSGEIWVVLRFTGGKPGIAGKYLGAEITSAAGAGQPFMIVDTVSNKDFDLDPPVYYFCLATIINGDIIQHAMGALYLQIKPATEFPYGPP